MFIEATVDPIFTDVYRSYSRSESSRSQSRSYDRRSRSRSHNRSSRRRDERSSRRHTSYSPERRSVFHLVDFLVRALWPMNAVKTLCYIKEEDPSSVEFYLLWNDNWTTELCFTISQLWESCKLFWKLNMYIDLLSCSSLVSVMLVT